MMKIQHIIILEACDIIKNNIKDIKTIKTQGYLIVKKARELENK